MLYINMQNRHFNPHSPRRLWRQCYSSRKECRNFNPHSPRRLWLAATMDGEDIAEFQSTQPSQAVTVRWLTARDYRLISIHTALAGCDLWAVTRRRIWFYFNPHSPRRLWRCAIWFAAWNSEISIHTALAGCDAAVFGEEAAQIQFQSTQPSQAVTNIFPPVLA